MAKINLELSKLIDLCEAAKLVQRGLVGVKISLSVAMDFMQIEKILGPIADSFEKLKKDCSEEEINKALEKRYDLELPLIPVDALEGKHDVMPLLAKWLYPVLDLNKTETPK